MNAKALILIVTMLPCTLYAEGGHVGEIARIHFGFCLPGAKGIASFDSDGNELERLIGVPERRKNDAELTLVWPGLTIKMNQKWEYDSQTGKYQIIPNKYLVAMITVESREYPTIDGIAVGDSTTQIVKRYGEPYSKTDSLYQYLHNEPDEVWNLNFGLQNGKVNRIWIIRGD